MKAQEFWNTYAGPGWAAHAGRIESMNAPLGAAALAEARVQPGERVLDVGCGTGGSSLALAALTGPTGRVVGLDLSAPMLAAAGPAPAWVTFVRADIEAPGALEAGAFDVAYSRMCLMLLDDPVRGCRRIAEALRPGGRLAAAVFRGMADNPWLPAVMLGAAPHLGPLPPLPLPGEPGPFAFAEARRAAEVLRAAGFDEVRVEPFDVLVTPEGSDDEVADLLIALGPASGAYLAARPEAQAEARAGTRTLLARFRDGEGRLALPCGGWVLTGRSLLS